MMMTSATGSNRGRRRAAFTLVELTIVVFIMATILAIAVPSFLRSFNRSQVDAAARSLVTLSQLARLKAALHQRPVELHCDLEVQAVWLTQSLDGEDGVETSIVHKRIELPQQARLIAVQLTEAGTETGEALVRYYPNGTCDGATLVLQGREKSDRLQLVIDPVTARATPYEGNP